MFRWLIPLLVSIAVFLLARMLQIRLREMHLRRQALAVVLSPSGQAPADRRLSIRALLFRLLPLFAAWQTAWVTIPWKIKVERALARQPEWRGRTAAEWLVLKELCLLGGLGAGLVLEAGILIALAMAAFAFYLPDLWLREQENTRRKSLMRELPDMLDLLASCMEAGLGFEQAVDIILERRTRGVLQLEFAEMVRTLRMGLSRQDALKTMGEKVGDADFTTFVSALIQAERLGVSVAQTLKQQANRLRTKRAQYIEKQALEAPVKLLFPLVVFIFPVVFLVLFGPIIIRFMQGF